VYLGIGSVRIGGREGACGIKMAQRVLNPSLIQPAAQTIR